MDDTTESLLDALEDAGADPRQSLEESFIGDVPLYFDCLKKFVHDQNMEILRISLTPDLKNVAIRAVHTMKGNADYLGLFPVLDAAMIILKALRADQLDLAVAGMSRLEDVYARFTAILKEHGIS